MVKDSLFDTTSLNEEIFSDRQHAGKYIGSRLRSMYSAADDALPMVVAIGRGGIPVAYETSRVLGVPYFSALGCRKIPCNTNRMVPIGVATAEGVAVVNDQMVRITALPEPVLDAKKAQAIKDAKFDQTAFDASSHLGCADFTARDVVLVDDGISTGMTALSAIRSMKQRAVRSITLAAPVVSNDVLPQLERECDAVVYSFKMNHILSLEDYYNDFPRVTLAEATRLLSTQLMFEQSSKLASAV
jgi:predicted phosphoribosyltransferase